MGIKFSTQSLEIRDRVPFWVEVASKAYFKHDLNAKPEEFSGSLAFDQLGAVGLSECHCSPCNVIRTRKDIARDDIDDYILSIPLAGRSHYRWGDRTVVIEPGTIVLKDTARPLHVEHQGRTRSLFVSMPRKALAARLGNRIPVAYAIPGRLPAPGLAVDFLKGLVARAHALDQDLHGRLGEQALDLIALGLAAGSDGAATLHSPRAITLLRLKSKIDANLADHGFRPAQAAAAAGISVRYANALLADEGTSLERYILQRRLERCRAALEDPLQRHRMIGDIALSWGFSDHSHFTRRFRDAFGITPGEYRQQQEEACAAGSARGRARFPHQSIVTPS